MEPKLLALLNTLPRKSESYSQFNPSEIPSMYSFIQIFIAILTIDVNLDFTKRQHSCLISMNKHITSISSIGTIDKKCFGRSYTFTETAVPDEKEHKEYQIASSK